MTIEFSNSLTKRQYVWSEFKAYLNTRHGTLQYEDLSDYYMLWFYDGPEVFLCNIWKVNIPDDILLQWNITQQQNDNGKLDFENNYKNNSNKFIIKINDEGQQIVVNEPRSGSELIYATHNFCDPVSWFADSERSENETLTDVGDGYSFSSSHLNWIDMISGRVLDDDGLVDEQQTFNPEDPHGYKVTIQVDGYDKVMRVPFEQDGGDYEVYWDDGYVKFFESQAGKVVTASYSYANGSTFYIKPAPGKVIKIEAAEADFSSGLIQNDTIEYSIWGYVDTFAPQYMYKRLTGYATFTNNDTSVIGTGTEFTTEVTPGQYIRLEDAGPESYMVVGAIISDTEIILAAPYAGPSGTLTVACANEYTGVYPSLTKIPLKTGFYKRYTQILREAIGAYPTLSPNAANPEHYNLSIKEFRRISRGSRTETQSTPFRYATVRELKSSQGLELRVRLLHNRAFDGESATITFYCTSDNE